jgi:sphingolipid delta-4 desaturase
MVIVNFIRDKEVGIFARAKRLGKGRALEVPPGIDVQLLRCNGAQNDDSGISGIDDTGEDKDSDSSDDKCD